MNRKAKSSLGEMVLACERFNEAHKVNSEILVYPGAFGKGAPVKVMIVMPGAYVLRGHTAVVQVSGGHGCIALTHVVAVREMPNG
jgi:hypothetical protein